MLRALAMVVVCTLTGAAAAQDWLYTFRPGDTVWAVAEKYCGSNRYAARIVQHNQLPNTRAVRPGTRLKIPLNWLVKQPVEAEVVSVFGIVWLHAATTKAAQVGDRISIGDRLETAQGSALVALADGSQIAINAHSDIRFQLMSAFGDTGMVDSHINISSGRTVTRAAGQRPGSRLRISSPAGTAAVRGTEFRVAVIQNDNTLTETLEGEVAFRQANEVAIPAGYGVHASNTGIVKEALLPAPQWHNPAGRHAEGTRFHWRPLAGANRYRVSIFAATNLSTPILQELVLQPELVLPSLAYGRYQLRTRGISDVGLEGFDAPLDIEIAPPAPEILSVTDTPSEAPQLRWSGNGQPAPYIVQVAEDVNFVQLKFEQEITDNSAQPNLDPGRYHWRVRGRDSVFSEAQELVVAPASPASLSSKSSARDAANLTWEADNNVEYRVLISRDAAFDQPLIDISTRENTYSASLPGGRRYYARVITQRNGIDSQPAELSFAVKGRSPWWLLSALLIPFAL